jgi:hypothetical protein
MKDATDQEKWATGLIKKYYQDQVRNINRTSAGTTCDASPCAAKQAKSEKAARLAAAQAEAAASSDGGMLTPILVAVFGVPAGSVSSAHPKKNAMAFAAPHNRRIWKSTAAERKGRAAGLGACAVMGFYPFPPAFIGNVMICPPPPFPQHWA